MKPCSTFQGREADERIFFFSFWTLYFLPNNYYFVYHHSIIWWFKAVCKSYFFENMSLNFYGTCKLSIHKKTNTNWMCNDELPQGDMSLVGVLLVRSYYTSGGGTKLIATHTISCKPTHLCFAHCSHWHSPYAKGRTPSHLEFLLCPDTHCP